MMVGTAAVAALASVALMACGSDSGSSSGSGSSGDLCSYAKDLEQSLGSDAFDNMDKATFDQIQEIVGNVKDKAPEEIKDDVNTVAEGFASVQKIFAKYDYDLTKLTAAAAADPDLTKQLQAAGGEDFTAASDRVSTYLEDTCGITGGS
jgi:hypothetical protein